LLANKYNNIIQLTYATSEAWQVWRDSLISRRKTVKTCQKTVKKRCQKTSKNI